MATTKKKGAKTQAHVRLIVDVYVPLKAQSLIDAVPEAEGLKFPAIHEAVNDDANLMDYSFRTISVGNVDWDAE